MAIVPVQDSDLFDTGRALLRRPVERQVDVPHPPASPDSADFPTQRAVSALSVSDSLGELTPLQLVNGRTQAGQDAVWSFAAADHLQPFCQSQVPTVALDRASDFTKICSQSRWRFVVRELDRRALGDEHQAAQVFARGRIAFRQLHVAARFAEYAPVIIGKSRHEELRAEF
jgi:hypothetical protein